MADDGVPDVEVLDVFVVDDEGELATAEWWQRPAPEARRPVAPTPDGPAPPEQPAPPDPPPTGGGGAPGSTPPLVRTIGEFDVFRAVVVEPEVATRHCLDGSAFRGVDGLRVDPRPVRVDGQTSIWRARVRTGRRRFRAAELLVHPSPSWVLTVVELRPVHTRGGRRRFIRAGLSVVDRLGDRLVDLAAR